jgi:hypothetical protein
MPDPQVLYVVTAVVVLALIAWVVAVLTGTGSAPAASKSTVAAAGAGGPTPAVLENENSKTIPASPPTELEDKKSARPPVISALPYAGAGSSEVQVDVEEEEEPTGPHALILISAVGRTDPGLKRKHNEDSYSILENHHLFVIADGMGRHAAGEVASKMAVEGIGESFEKKLEPSFVPEGVLPKRASMLRNAILARRRGVRGHGDHRRLLLLLAEQPAGLHRARRRQPVLPVPWVVADADHQRPHAGRGRNSGAQLIGPLACRRRRRARRGRHDDGVTAPW